MCYLARVVTGLCQCVIDAGDSSCQGIGNYIPDAGSSGFVMLILLVLVLVSVGILCCCWY